MGSRTENFFLQGEIAVRYVASFKKELPLSGEKMLMLAVLEEAVDCYKCNCFATNRKGQRLFAETEEWLLARGDNGLFTFENLCEALGFDADYLRAGIQRWKENQLIVRDASSVRRAKSKDNKLRRRKRSA